MHEQKQKVGAKEHFAKEIWKVFLEGLSFDDKHQCRTEWRILWRRVAGGLKAGQQLELYEQLFPSLPIDESKIKTEAPNRVSPLL